jgi:hypothetical protein
MTALPEFARGAVRAFDAVLGGAARVNAPTTSLLNLARGSCRASFSKGANN